MLKCWYGHQFPTVQWYKKYYHKNIQLQNANQKVLCFGSSNDEMIHLLKVYYRSLLEPSSVFWDSGLRRDLKRTRKIWSKLVFRENYGRYKEALSV